MLIISGTVVGVAISILNDKVITTTAYEHQPRTVYESKPHIEEVSLLRTQLCGGFFFIFSLNHSSFYPSLMYMVRAAKIL